MNPRPRRADVAAGFALGRPAGFVSGYAAVFVYYRLPVDHAAAFATARARLQRADLRPAGLGAPALMRRLHADEQGRETWMEVWPLHAPTFAEASLEPDALRSALDTAAASAGVAELIEGQRHYEFFEPCA